MKIEIDKDWCLNAARREGNHGDPEIGAGILAADIPRRNDLFRLVPAESAIVGAMYAVEAMPADVRLTEAAMLLQQAKDKVADYVDSL